MTDPAIEAANRAIDTFLADEHDNIPIEAAREALKPIRKLYEELAVLAFDSRDPERQGERYVLSRLAPLIYTTEELGNDQ